MKKEEADYEAEVKKVYPDAVVKESLFDTFKIVTHRLGILSLGGWRSSIERAWQSAYINLTTKKPA